MVYKLETTFDVDREQLIIDILNGYGKIQFERYTDGLYGDFDFVGKLENVIKSYVELKCRQNSSTSYKTLIISYSKYNKLLEKRKLGFGAKLIASFSDGKIYGIDVKDIDGTAIRQFARTKGRVSGLVGANDSELVVDIPVKLMRCIGYMTSDQLLKYLT